MSTQIIDSIHAEINRHQYEVEKLQKMLAAYATPVKTGETTGVKLAPKAKLTKTPKSKSKKGNGELRDQLIKILAESDGRSGMSVKDVHDRVYGDMAEVKPSFYATLAYYVKNGTIGRVRNKPGFYKSA